MIKGSIQQEDITFVTLTNVTLTFVTIYVPSIEALNIQKQILIDLKGEIESNTILMSLIPH